MDTKGKSLDITEFIRIISVLLRQFLLNKTLVMVSNNYLKEPSFSVWGNGIFPQGNQGQMLASRTAPS